MPLLSEQRDDSVAKGGQILWGVAFADAAGILIERDVADVVRTVFDAPVASPPSEQLGRTGLVAWYAGDRVVDFDRLLAVSLGGANDPADLR